MRCQMYLKMVTNEYGFETAQHICNDCGDVYTVMPPMSEDCGWDSCLSHNCPSYDVTRDIDSVWEGVQSFLHSEPAEPEA